MTTNANAQQSEVLTLREVEREYIINVLVKKNYNRTYTARALGIGIRTLQRKLVRYGLKDVFSSETPAAVQE